MSNKPDRNKFLEDLQNAVDQFLDHKYDKVIAISHNDADGISSLHIIQNLLYNMNIQFDFFIYNRSVSWPNYLHGILSKNQTDKIALIFTDVGSNLSELVPFIRSRREHFYILDHHEIDVNLDEIKIPENLFFVNPTSVGYDGLDHIAGATLAFMFAKKIKPKPVLRQGWLTVIGIAGDTLRSTDKLQSFNREIYEELLEEEQIQDNKGLILFGGMQESIKNGLKYSILPFIQGLGGQEGDTIVNFLKDLKINPNKKVIDLSLDEIENIQKKGNFESFGNFATLQHKQGILKFAFEHALLLNILCFKNINSAISIIQKKSINIYAKGIYYEYLFNLVKNLRTLIELSRYETDEAIFIEAEEKIPASNWSDTASFSVVNEILDPYKVLFLGGEEKKNHTIKLSIRCSRKFLEKNKGNGVNIIINRIKEDLGGMGGGHKLAGGLRLSKPSFERLKKSISDYI
ncbi:MAG: DHHA1 domain-containing protein [Candidatus Hermodarchaeota archaeon]